MNILIYTPTVGRGGVHRIVEKITHALARVGTGHTFHVLGQQHDENGERVNYPDAWSFTQIDPVEKLPAHPAQFDFLWKHADDFYDHLKRLALSFDVIWCPAVWWTMLIKKPWEIETPFVATVQDFAFDMIDMGLLSQHFREVSRLVAQRSTLTIFTSGFQREHGERVYNFKNTRIIRHTGDFVSDGFNPTPKEALRIREKYNLPHAGYVLAFHPLYHKDPFAILYAQLYARQNSPHVPPLVFAGVNTQYILSEQPPKDHHIRKIRQVLQAIGATPGKDFFALGYVPDEDIAGLYAGATVSITASKSEGDLPGNLLEAARARTPVIYSDFAVLTESLGTDNQYGLCFPMGEPYELGKRLIEVCENPDAARERATALYGLLNRRTADDVARDHLDVFLEAVNGSRFTSPRDALKPFAEAWERQQFDVEPSLFRQAWEAYRGI